MTSEYMENSKFGVIDIISLAYIKHSYVSLLEPWQNNLRNPDAHSEPCQTYKMKCFAKPLKGNIFRKTLHLKCLTEF